MIIRSAALDTTRRTLPLNRPVLARRVAQNSPIDSFEPVQIAPSPTIVAKQQALNVSGGSSSGGFFSGLFSRLKSIAGGFLSQIGTWFSSNVGGYISKAQTYASDLVGGLLGKAATWFQGLLSKWMTKLGT
jgi:hypothetical protein